MRQPCLSSQSWPWKSKIPLWEGRIHRSHMVGFSEQSFSGTLRHRKCPEVWLWCISLHWVYWRALYWIPSVPEFAYFRFMLYDAKYQLWYFNSNRVKRALTIMGWSLGYCIYFLFILGQIVEPTSFQIKWKWELKAHSIFMRVKSKNCIKVLCIYKF